MHTRKCYDRRDSGLSLYIMMHSNQISNKQDICDAIQEFENLLTCENSKFEYSNIQLFDEYPAYSITCNGNGLFFMFSYNFLGVTPEILQFVTMVLRYEKY